MSNPRKSALTLVHELSRLEWGELGGAQLRSHRVVLEAVARIQYAAKCDLRGMVTVTVQQIATAAGYSLRHTGDALRDLEDAGYITWHRGGIIDGHARPSFMRIVKKRLARAIKAARAPFEALQRARAIIARRRIADLQRRRYEKKLSGHYRRSRHKATVAALSTFSSESSSPALPGRATTNAETNPQTPKADMNPNHPLYAYLPTHCTHAAGVPTLCPYCTEEALKVHARERSEYLAEQSKEEELFTAARLSEDAYCEYMEDTYPGVHPRYWARIVNDDPQAKALAIAAADARYRSH